MSTRVAVIGGGQNCEHEVSLASAAGIAAALDPTKYRPVRLTIGRDGRWSDANGVGLALPHAITLLQSCAVAIPALHGPRGEDGTVAALLDLTAVPYVGSGVRAGALAMDKHATKLLAANVGVATAPGVLLTQDSSYRWTHPVVVKPVAAGSSQGVALVRTAADLGPALAAAFALDDRILVEDVVVGREIDLAVLARPDGTRAVAPALEIVVDGLFDAGTKYDGSADFRIPAPLHEAELASLESAAVRVFDALGCNGIARVDFFLTADGPVLNEVNTMPGFTAASQVPKMFAAAGISYTDLLDLLVTDALAASGRVVPLPA
ncbi:D-alanine--D-alanine ligase family protein [Nocardioides marmorisolisilvae]|uniref:D-alanine--D-alanine ligase n=1 Tax=Nocardioides marmorisolisilvae TaxID=1542737 RepID=A0A3N0E0U5_9ACTN|nr:D-alanine--D-alanine ligase [Nocardioides marmorisolisilvae]RNL81440.1 D-alanine--D-alanine ligase [Nocardioides marmorisolisilvae]